MGEYNEGHPSLFDKVWQSLPSEILDQSPRPDGLIAKLPPASPMARALRFCLEGNAKAARRLANQAMKEATLTGRGEDLVYAAMVKSFSLVLSGNLDEANRLLCQYEGWARLQTPPLRAVIQETRGWWAVRSARWRIQTFAEAAQTFTEAAHLYQSVGDIEGELRCQEGRAIAEFGQGEYFIALDSLSSVLKRSLEHGIIGRLHRIAFQISVSGKDCGYENFALTTLPQVMHWCRVANDVNTLGYAMLAYADVLFFRGDAIPSRADMAESILLQVIPLLHQNGLQLLELKARHQLLGFYRRLRRQAEVEKLESQMTAFLQKLPGQMGMHYVRWDLAEHVAYNEKLKDQVEKLRRTLNSVQDAVLVFDIRPSAAGDVADYYCDSGNQAAFNLLGYTQSGVIVLPEVDRHPVMQGVGGLIHRCHTEERSFQEEVEVEVDGQTRHYLRFAIPVSPGVAVCIRDITDRVAHSRKLEAAVHSSVEETLRLDAQRRELLEVNRKLDRLATTDGLTGTLNYRTFRERLHTAAAAARRGDHALSLILLDIDYFKRFNDEFGHQVGDQVLQAVVKTIGGVLRPQDLLARYGGEEFAVLLPDTAKDLAANVAERIRRTVEESPWREMTVTISLGVAAMDQSAPLKDEEIIQQADHALYASKRGGRNRVTVAP